MRKGTRKIPLTMGKFAIVDAEDFEELSRWKWHIGYSRKGKDPRACRWDKSTEPPQLILMHRQIMGLVRGDGLQVDHINHDGLDNRRANLRVVTNRQNHENRRRKSPHGAGVIFSKKSKKKPFKARAWIAGKVRCLGAFDTAQEAKYFRDLCVGTVEGRNFFDKKYSKEEAVFSEN